MSDTSRTAPDFATQIRGYDRVQVDTYIAKLAERMVEARTRVEQAEDKAGAAEREARQLRERLEEAEAGARSGAGGDTAPPATSGVAPSFSELGDEVARVLQTAAQSAEDVRRKAREEADAMLADAQGRAAEIVREAEERGASKAEEAERERALADEYATTTRQEAENTANDTRQSADNDAAEVRRRAEARAAELDEEARRARAEAEEFSVRTREQAEAEGRETRRRADEDATANVAEAESRATQLISEAERESEVRRQRGQADAERVVADAERVHRETMAEIDERRRVAKDELDELVRRKDNVVAELVRLRGVLDEATTHLERAIADEPGDDLDDLDDEPSHSAPEEPAPGEVVTTLEPPPERVAAQDRAVDDDETQLFALEHAHAESAADSPGNAQVMVESTPPQAWDAPTETMEAPPEPEEEPAHAGGEFDELVDLVVRKLKRALQDEQNLILDGIRQAGEVSDPAGVVPDAGDLSNRLEGAALTVVADAFPPGGNESAGVSDRVREAIRADLAQPLHAEVVTVLEQAAKSGEGGVMTSDRVSKVFRMWRTERLEPAIYHLVERAVATR